MQLKCEFIGGTGALYKWLSNNLRYPSAAVMIQAWRRVFVKGCRGKTAKYLNLLKGIGLDVMKLCGR
jgi:hypothetical protein